MKEDLIIFEIANNHNGDLSHGLKIIDDYSKMLEGLNLSAKFAFKFQLRHLPTFIRQNFQGSETKYVKRFEDTSLSKADFLTLAKRVKENGHNLIATIFDEDSIPLFKEMDCDYVKIASCSLSDHLLLDRLSLIDKPKILSTGGASLCDIHEALNVLKGTKDNCALLHCVAIYPTPNSKLHMHEISQLRKNFPAFRIGFSSHEELSSQHPIYQAVGQGATIFERHIDIKSDKYQINSYSLDLEQAKNWLSHYKEAISLYGAEQDQVEKTKILEKENLLPLQRGVDRETFKASFPKQPNDLTCRDAYLQKNSTNSFEARFLRQVHEGLFLLNNLEIKTNEMLEAIASFPLGTEKFHIYGAVYFHSFEDNICLEKFIYLKKGQKILSHHHDDRKEHMQVLSGTGSFILEEREIELKMGVRVSVRENQHHEIQANTDLIIKETIFKNNKTLSSSIYHDPMVPKPESSRKKKILISESLNLQ